MPKIKNTFSDSCVRCDRLASFLSEIRLSEPSYFAKPVPSFGCESPKILVVGLAPGMHGANRTGRPFTGDYAGILLYETLHKFGFSNKSDSVSKTDGLTLIDVRITNAVRCLPPQNKPNGEEVKNCNHFLLEEINRVKKSGVIIALGGLAHGACLRALELKQALFPFGHESLHQLPNGLSLLSSYHCSRYNTQTKRLTESMFHAVFEKAKSLVS